METVKMLLCEVNGALASEMPKRECFIGFR